MSSRFQGLFDSVKEILPRLPELLLYIGVAVFLLDEFLRVTFSITLLSTSTYDLRISLAVSLIALFIFTMNHRMDELEAGIEQARKQFFGIIEVLPPHQYIDFPNLISSCRIVRLLALAGTRAGFLGDSKVRDAFLDPARKSKITILLANPFSAAIQERYQRDEPDTYEAGPAGIERRLVALYDLTSNLRPEAADTIDVRVYDCYPTISVLQADDDLYSTTYGHKLRGADCPKVHCSAGGEYAKFLLKHFQEVYADGVPLVDWIRKHHPELEKKSP